MVSCVTWLWVCAVRARFSTMQALGCLLVGFCLPVGLVVVLLWRCLLCGLWRFGCGAVVGLGLRVSVTDLGLDGLDSMFRL